MERVVNLHPLPLEGRIAMVTGAARGIGLELMRALLAAGASVEGADCDASALGESIDSLNREAAQTPGPRREARGTPVDLRSSRAVDDWFDAVWGQHGQLDVVVNNAGVQLNRAAIELSDEDWTDVLDINLNAAFYVCRAAGRRLCAQGSGAVVQISSVAERFGLARRVPYGVSKAALSSLTRVLAVEWAPHGVRVNAVAPGYVETDLVRTAFERGHINRDEIVAKIPLGRLATPRSIADAVTFLVSDAADYITGQTLFVDGGYSVSK
jgi:NAD(P)-dependent dehydrogenase (short-subunit alcohol dehydrogenase family)